MPKSQCRKLPSKFGKGIHQNALSNYVMLVDELMFDHVDITFLSTPNLSKFYGKIR